MAHRSKHATQPVAVAPSGPTTPVPKDPQPSVDRIDELARRILKGDILLPKFQRDFVWERRQIISLLDSVARGFPIGSVLLWQSRQELGSERRIAELDIEFPQPDYPVNYLLDGQQRLSTICGALFWTGDKPTSRWNIAYDLRDQRFFHVETLDDLPQHQLRVSKLSDAASFFRQVANLDALVADDRDTLKERAEALFNRFKDYKIATVTLGDMSIHDVAPIFERINSTGTPLTMVDLMRAATWRPDFDLMDAIDEILGDLAERDFHTIDKRCVLRNISASAGGGFSADSIEALRKHESSVLKKATSDTREAYKCMVDFLTTQFGVKNADALPHANQLVVAGEIFRCVPQPTAEQYAAICRWWWRTSMSSYFDSWNSRMMATDLEAVRSFANGKPNIDITVKIPGADIWESRSFRLNSAHAKLLGLILAHARPIDLLTGQAIDTGQALSWINLKEFHHFFPQGYLAKRGIDAACI